MRYYYIYILASKKNGVLYTGVTNNLMRRVYEHKNKIIKGFTEKYFINKLVYFEQHNYIDAAIIREKQIKKWKRQWKIDLIEQNNKDWKDLYYEYGGAEADEAMKDSDLGNMPHNKKRIKIPASAGMTKNLCD